MLPSSYLLYVRLCVSSPLWSELYLFLPEYALYLLILSWFSYLSGWRWDLGDQWREHQGHEARPRHWTDQKRWPKSPPGPKEGRWLRARIWWVNLREHPILPCLHPMRSPPQRGSATPLLLFCALALSYVLLLGDRPSTRCCRPPLCLCAPG